MLNKLKVRNRWKKKSCLSSEVVWISIEKSGSALKSPDRISTYNLLTNVKMDPKNLYLFPWDQASTMMLMLLFVGHVNKCRKALVNNLIKKKFYGEKKTINVLTAFFIFHKSDVKTFLKWILNQCPTALVNISLLLIGKFFYTKDWKNIKSL